MCRVYLLAGLCCPVYACFVEHGIPSVTAARGPETDLICIREDEQSWSCCRKRSVQQQPHNKYRKESHVAVGSAQSGVACVCPQRAGAAPGAEGTAGPVPSSPAATRTKSSEAAPRGTQLISVQFQRSWNRKQPNRRNWVAIGLF